MEKNYRNSAWLLWAGDVFAFGLITLIGFSSHGSLRSAQMSRILATFLPFSASWILFACWGGVSRPYEDRPWRWLLRSGISAFLAAPLAATLRALWLGTTALPVFILVMGSVSMLGIMLWRLLYQRAIQPRF
jgi:hypothetical protein